MRMGDRIVLMWVGMRLVAVPVEVVCVPVMFVVPVTMAVLHRLMRVSMFVTLAQMQPDAQPHENGGGPERPRRHLRPEDEGQRHAEQRGNREIRASARGAEVAQRHNEERKAHAISCEAGDHCRERRPGFGQMGA